MLGLMVVPRKRSVRAAASGNPQPSTSDAAWQQTPDALGTGPVGTVALVLFAKRALWLVFLSLGGFSQPGRVTRRSSRRQGRRHSDRVCYRAVCAATS